MRYSGPVVLEQHVAGLREERQRLQAEVTKAQGALQELQEQLQRVQVALNALTGSSKAKKKAGGGGVKTHEVIALMKAVLQAGSLDADELSKRVAEQLKNKGKTLTGYKLRFEQALKDASFEREGDRVALAADGGEAVSKTA